tara:strand:- start:454 stop:882 length:429 start_codon:yes stop_codon:yes gene_type:complete
MKFFKEFKEFALKGSMFDMAVGIIIGGAFSKVVSSLVNDIIMPPLAVLLGQVKLGDLKWLMKPEQLNADGEMLTEAVYVNYGMFLQVLIDFTIIAFSIFLVVKVFNRLRNKAENSKDKTVVTPKDIQLLSEIRDLLQDQKKA